MDLGSGKNFIGPVSQATQHTMFEAILLVVVCGLFYWFMISPKIVALDASKSHLATITEENSKVADNRAKLERAIADLKAHPNEVKELDESLPLDNRVTKLYIALNALTANTGMTIGDISISGGNDQAIAGNVELLNNPFKAKRVIQKLTTTISAQGTFDQFQGLLQKLETSGRLMNITSIGVTAGKDGAFEFKINLEAYFYE